MCVSGSKGKIMDKSYIAKLTLMYFLCSLLTGTSGCLCVLAQFAENSSIPLIEAKKVIITGKKSTNTPLSVDLP